MEKLYIRYRIEKEEEKSFSIKYNWKKHSQKIMKKIMKSNSNLYSCVAVMAMTTMLATASFFAADVQATEKTNTTVIGKGNSELGTMRGGYSILGSKFIGMEVKNDQGSNLGEVKDIMIDSTGKVRYAAVSYGGFMGMGPESVKIHQEKVAKITINILKFQ